MPHTHAGKRYCCRTHAGYFCCMEAGTLFAGPRCASFDQIVVFFRHVFVLSVCSERKGGGGGATSFCFAKQGNTKYDVGKLFSLRGARMLLMLSVYIYIYVILLGPFFLLFCFLSENGLLTKNMRGSYSAKLCDHVFHLLSSWPFFECLTGVGSGVCCVHGFGVFPS